MDTQQGTPAWFNARRGKLTASNFGAAAGVNPYCSRRKALRRENGEEVFTGNAACTWGTQNEKNAIKDYMVRTGNVVKSKGFFTHTSFPWLGGSPDGLVGDVGLIEVKCPFVKMFPHERIPVYYYCQINGLLEILDKEWCDYITWTPTEFKVYRVYRDRDLWEFLLERYAIFYACMQRGCAEIPNMRADERKAILARLAESEASHINYEFWRALEPARLQGVWVAPPDCDDESSSKEETDDASPVRLLCEPAEPTALP